MWHGCSIIIPFWTHKPHTVHWGSSHTVHFPFNFDHYMPSLLTTYFMDWSPHLNSTTWQHLCLNVPLALLVEIKMVRWNLFWQSYTIFTWQLTKLCKFSHCKTATGHFSPPPQIQLDQSVISIPLPPPSGENLSKNWRDWTFFDQGTPFFTQWLTQLCNFSHHKLQSAISHPEPKRPTHCFHPLTPDQ